MKGRTATKSRVIPQLRRSFIQGSLLVATDRGSAITTARNTTGSSSHTAKGERFHALVLQGFKKVERLTKQEVFPVYVSVIRPANAQVEVSLELPQREPQKLQPISSLKVDQVVNGTIDRIEDYGAMVRLDGINRPGLLHIRQIAEWYGGFLNKTIGIKERLGSILGQE